MPSLCHATSPCGTASRAVQAPVAERGTEPAPSDRPAHRQTGDQHHRDRATGQQGVDEGHLAVVERSVELAVAERVVEGPLGYAQRLGDEVPGMREGVAGERGPAVVLDPVEPGLQLGVVVGHVDDRRHPGLP